MAGTQRNQIEEKGHMNIRIDCTQGSKDGRNYWKLASKSCR